MNRQAQNPQDVPSDQKQFAEYASESGTGFVRELLDYLRQNKKWWLTPIILAILLLGLLVILGGTSLAPFIYTLF